MTNDKYKQDILNCMMNLSSEEVFTPPKVANDILNLLPEEIWKNPNIKFLDPCTKSGVFLREIAKRLNIGLKEEIPDLQERINHIMKEQLYGISLSELTALMSRRTLYCSKNANDKYSIAEGIFKNNDGNIHHNNKNIDDNDIKKNIEEIFKGMKFDVIIGNPPYQQQDGGAQKSAKPLYHKFIETAKKLNPTYITMIIPARWYNGGKGLDNFREEMLNDEKLSIIHDFPETSDCFSNLNIRGGVCYFLWDKNHAGDCTVYNHKNGEIIDKSTRPLLEDGAKSFIRFNKSINILKKVKSKNEKTMDELVSPRKPFGLATNFKEFKETSDDENNIKLYRNKSQDYVSKDKILKNAEWIDMYKVFEPYASPGSDDYPHLILSKPIVGYPGTACTETYLVINPTNDENIAKNVALYMETQFFRFMLSLLKSTQHITRKVYAYVPQQDFTKTWTDEMLYSKYGITEEEIKFINTIIKPLQ